MSQQIKGQFRDAVDFAMSRHAVISTLSHMLESGYLLRPVFDRLAVQALRCPHVEALSNFAAMLAGISADFDNGTCRRFN